MTWSHIEIHGGIVLAEMISDRHCTRSSFTRTGQYRFYVDAVEPDGFRFSLWDGSSYERAIIEAAEVGSDHGNLEVRDCVLGGCE